MFDTTYSYVTATQIVLLAHIRSAGSSRWNGWLFPLRLSRTDGGPQSRWRDRTSESWLIDIQPHCSPEWRSPDHNATRCPFIAVQSTASLRPPSVYIALCWWLLVAFHALGVRSANIVCPLPAFSNFCHVQRMITDCLLSHRALWATLLWWVLEQLLVVQQQSA